MSAASALVRVDEDTVDYVAGLEDDEFLEFVLRNLYSSAPKTQETWAALCHPDMLDRTWGCLTEIAARTEKEVVPGSQSGRQRKMAAQFAQTQQRLIQVEAAIAKQERIAAHEQWREKKASNTRGALRQLALAVNAHRLAARDADMAPEPHDLALWDALDGIWLLDSDPEREPVSLAELVVGGWVNMRAGSDDEGEVSES